MQPLPTAAPPLLPLCRLLPDPSQAPQLEWLSLWIAATAGSVQGQPGSAQGQLTTSMLAGLHRLTSLRVRHSPLLLPLLAHCACMPLVVLQGRHWLAEGVERRTTLCSDLTPRCIEGSFMKLFNE